MTTINSLILQATKAVRRPGNRLHNQCLLFLSVPVVSLFYPKQSDFLCITSLVPRPDQVRCNQKSCGPGNEASVSPEEEMHIHCTRAWLVLMSVCLSACMHQHQLLP